MARSAVNMWIRDRLEVDSRFTQTPKQFIRELENNIDRLHPDQRLAAVDYARNLAVLYYGDRHKGTPVPHNVTARIERLEHRAEKANEHDRARAFVSKYGPPERALAMFMKAPERTREIKTKIPDTEYPGSMSSKDIPWMMHKGLVADMSKNHLEQAQRSYEAWPHKEKHSFVEYVTYVQRQWNKSPVERGGDRPARQHEKSRDVEVMSR